MPFAQAPPEYFCSTGNYGQSLEDNITEAKFFHFIDDETERQSSQVMFLRVRD